MSTPTIQLSALTALTVAATQQAAQTIRTFHDPLAVETKQDGSSVTQVDVETQRLLCGILLPRLPGVTIIGEETLTGTIDPVPCEPAHIDIPVPDRTLAIADIVFYVGCPPPSLTHRPA